jgi:quinol monooxygenase YgiN
VHTFAEWVGFQPQCTEGEIIMAAILVQSKVKDFANWKTVFDSQEAFRTSSGQVSKQVYRDASDPNKVTILAKWNSVANAQKFAQSPELKAAMEKAGVEGAPTFTFLNEA